MAVDIKERGAVAVWLNDMVAPDLVVQRQRGHGRKSLVIVLPEACFGRRASFRLPAPPASPYVVLHAHSNLTSDRDVARAWEDWRETGSRCRRHVHRPASAWHDGRDQCGA